MYEFEKNKLYDLIGKSMVETLKEYKCIVAGGSITSLFTRHEINDIDIYFKDNDSIIKALQGLEDDGEYILSSTNKAGLFFAEDIDMANCSNYSTSENRVILKCIVRVSDYIDGEYYGESLRFNKCIPIEVIEVKKD